MWPVALPIRIHSDPTFGVPLSRDSPARVHTLPDSLPRSPPSPRSRTAPFHGDGPLILRDEGAWAPRTRGEGAASTTVSETGPASPPLPVRLLSRVRLSPRPLPVIDEKIILTGIPMASQGPCGLLFQPCLRHATRTRTTASHTATTAPPTRLHPPPSPRARVRRRFPDDDYQLALSKCPSGFQCQTYH